MADEEPVKKSKSKWIILVVLILSLGGGGFAAWKFDVMSLVSDMTGDAQPQKVEVTQGGAGLQGAVVALAPFRVNLSDPLGKRFIRLVVEVETANSKVGEELVTHQAPIRDTIILLLSSKSYADLATMESKILLKSEISERVNQVLGGPKVLQVFFTDIVIQ